jgi:BON domain-containing protein
VLVVGVVSYLRGSALKINVGLRAGDLRFAALVKELARSNSAREPAWKEVAVLLRTLCPAALGLCIGVGGGMIQGQEGPRDVTLPIPIVPEPGHLVLEPGPAKVNSEQSQNQHMADAIAERLHTSGRLNGYRVDIRFEGGAAELTGRVADAAQRAAVVGIVHAINGVQHVNDLLEVENGDFRLTAQDANEFQAPQPSLLQPQPPAVGGAAAGAFGGGMPQEPVSIMPGMGGFNPGMPNPAMQQPPLPPYAWPTYAPYNNYSRVGYPTLYPHEAFPFIGPMYPFPKVPLGWRAVTLRWQDGHWFYGKTATGHDWWRIRYY